LLSKFEVLGSIPDTGGRGIKTRHDGTHSSQLLRKMKQEERISPGFQGQPEAQPLLHSKKKKKEKKEKVAKCSQDHY
jgi:hypothetical protein